MSDYEMEIISKPKQGTASVLVLTKKGNYVMMKGKGSDSYLCGTCQNIICQDVNRGQIINLVFKCPNCDSYNRIRGT